jgi:hypothetical protein
MKKRFIKNVIQLKEDLQWYQHDLINSALFIEAESDELIIMTIYNTQNVREYIKQFVIENNAEPLRNIPDSEYLDNKLILNYISSNKQENPKNCWKINKTAAKKGTGYTMYTMLMSQLPQGHYLISDRGVGSSTSRPQNIRTTQVSRSAQSVWSRLFNDTDIFKKPIDNIYKPITPDKNDDGAVVYQLLNPNDINTSHFLDYMYRLKDSIKTQYQSNVDKLIENHDKFVSSLNKELINEFTKNKITSIKPSSNNQTEEEKTKVKPKSFDLQYNEINSRILDALERMGSKFFWLKYREK